MNKLGFIKHDGTFCTCTKQVFKNECLVDTVQEKLDYTEYKCLICCLDYENMQIHDSKFVKPCYISGIGELVRSICFQREIGHDDYRTEYVFDFME